MSVALAESLVFGGGNDAEPFIIMAERAFELSIFNSLCT